MTVILVAAVLVLLALAGATAVGTAVIERRHLPRGGFVPVTGGRLHVVDIGPPIAPTDGLPVVLLHGASGNLEDMRLALGDRLAVRRRVVAIDRPGHGFSDRPGGSTDATPSRQAALVLQALDALGIRRAIIVGYSWSGALATCLALAAPDRVAGLMLLAPVTHPWPGGISWYYRLAAMPVLGPLFARTLVLPAGALMLDSGSRDAFAPRRRPDDYIERAAAALVLRPAEFLANARDVAALKTSVAAQAPRYSTIGVPTVIITGDQDRTVSRQIHSEALAAVLPQARLIVLAGVGHMVHHAAADRVAAEIEWIAAQSEQAELPHAQPAATAGSAN